MREIRSVRSLLGAADPARGHQFPVPDYDFAGRIDERTLPPAAPHRLTPARGGLAAIGAVVATLAVAGGLAVINPLSTGNAPAFAATPPLIEVEYDQAAPSASEHLLSMADRVSSVPDEHGGPVTFVRTRAWALDMASSGDETVAAVVPYEQELWREPDKSALVRRTWLPPQFANERARRDWERTVGQTPDAGEEVVRYGPGEQQTVTPEPPSGDLAELTSQLYSHQPRADGAKSAIRAVADIYRDWVLPAPGARTGAAVPRCGSGAAVPRSSD